MSKNPDEYVCPDCGRSFDSQQGRSIHYRHAHDSKPYGPFPWDEGDPINADYREKCLAEKPAECVACDSEDNILVHHKDGNRTNHDLDNLVPLCSSCHAEVHMENREEFPELVAALDPDYYRGAWEYDREAGERLKKTKTGRIVDRSPLVEFDDSDDSDKSN